MKYAYLIAALVSSQVLAMKSCEELKTEIAENIDKNGVKQYTLDIVSTDELQDKTVVGSCEGGTKKIVYLNPRKSSNESSAECYWMENTTGNYNWVKASSLFGPGLTKDKCFSLDSCDGGEGLSGGGCYKWAYSAEGKRLPW
ncbi:DUF1161 domain-containing protein [Chitinimonas sp. PSY-7]|uniref:DUF1161 domain-containing protein n=1 Tax=Chitinimonas sp. PSY-7 TaxID=3459088 RepID=UPI0040401375